MLSHFQAVILGLLQGVSELFPISSLGHSIILPGLLGWNIDRNADYFLSFLVATHFATAAVLFVLYRRDWARIIGGFFRSLGQGSVASNPDAKLAWLLIVGTCPAGLVGLLLQKQVERIFASPALVAGFLALNGVLLYAAELLRAKAKNPSGARDADERLAAELSWPQAAGVGVMQVLALLPGFSRTGSTLAGGLMVGLAHEDSLRFSFLLATPIIGAAAVLKLPMLLSSRHGPALHAALLGGVCAAVTAYFSVKLLTRYFKTNTLRPFAVYCLLAGVLSLMLLHR